MQRREFMGAMLALFCATVLPEPLIEPVRLIQPVDPFDAMREIYMNGIIRNVVSDSDLLAVFGQRPNVDWQYREQMHYFELAPGR